MNSKEPDAFIRCEKLQFDTSDGQSIDVEAVFQDTMPSGSHIGAVLAIHGSPGSHKDFKYVMPLLQAKGIRFVGVNMPGYGLTPGDPVLRYDNTERNNFVHELIARIGNLERLVVLSHSRGSENAIGVAVRNMDKLAGLVLLNPTGLSPHRAVRPRWVIPFVLWLYSLGPTAKRIVHLCLKLFYNSVLGIRMDSGERAAICLKTMNSLEFEEGLRPLISTINDSPNVGKYCSIQARVLVAYTGKDFLIETSVSRKFVHSFHDCIEITCEEKGDSFEDSAVHQTYDLFSSGAKAVSIFFQKDGHYLQRDRARYVANSIEAILQTCFASNRS
ncbi:unnamed protein product [Angiostrongylus costaricensis]|uniref:AB hydrolase-1 domain-containing protein n=1 Tax=Angiostrongylus costaricensis TaxID=334426 RepID=A0A0R3PU33_ANGCS|nr:unnamed protein product [Angiostrongylus costaricensis]